MERLKLTFYVAQAIESLKTNVDARSWVKPIHELGKIQGIGMFDPVEREAQKTGTNCGDTGKYITGLKQGGHWEQFDDILTHIWWGNLQPESNKVRILLTLRDKFCMEGNSIEDLNHWGRY